MCSEQIIVSMAAPGLQLVVSNDKHGPCAQVWFGEYPEGAQISFTSVSPPIGRAHVSVDHKGKPDLWIGPTSFELPWFELMKVADFLRLPIDVPEPTDAAVQP